MNQQTITDQPDALAQAGATSAETTPESETQSGVSLEDVRDLVRDVVREENGAFWGAMRRQLTPMQERLSAVDALQDNVAGISETLVELGGTVRGTRAMVQRVLSGTASEEEVQAVLAAEDVAAKHDAVNRQKDAEIARLKRQADAVQRREPPPVDQPQQVEAVTRQQYAETYGPLAMKIATAQGLDFDRDLHAQLPKIPAGATHQQWLQWMDRVGDIAAGIADGKAKAAKPRVNIPSTRPAGAPAEPFRTNRERLAHAFAVREGKE